MSTPASDDKLTASYDVSRRIYAALRRLDAVFNRIEGPNAASPLRRHEVFLPFLYPSHCPGDRLEELDDLLHAETGAAKSPNYKASDKKGGSPKAGKGAGKKAGKEAAAGDSSLSEGEGAAAAAGGSGSDADKEKDKDKETDGENDKGGAEKEDKDAEGKEGQEAPTAAAAAAAAAAVAAPSPDGKAAALAAAVAAAAEAAEAARKERERERDRKLEYHKARVLDGTVKGDLRKLLAETLGDSECLLVFFTPCAGPSGSNFKVPSPL